MSSLKLGAVLAAVAATVLLVVAGPASATVLCKTAFSPCGSRYGAGTEVSGHLKPKMISKMEALDANFPRFEVECDESTFKFKTTNEGGPTQAVTANTEALSFNECWQVEPFSSYAPPVLLKKPSLELQWLSGPNARIMAKGIEFTTTYFGQDCVYGVPGGGSTGIAELRGGEAPLILLSMTLAKLNAAICPERMAWKAEYEVTTPKPLYAAAS